VRSLEINKRQIFYAQRVGTESVGDYGEARPVYSEPEPARMTVEYTDSSVLVAEYGKTSDCDVKLITAETDYPFDENTVFWIDAPTDAPHDYVMAKLPQRSLNGTVYSLRSAGVFYG